MPTMTPPPSTVSITVPADVRYFRTVRLAIGGLASLVGFDVEAMEDIRIGVDELCTALVEAGDGSSVRFEIAANLGEGLRIEGRSTRGAEPVDPERFRFSRQILSVVADDYGFETSDEAVDGWLERSVASEQA